MNTAIISTGLVPLVIGSIEEIIFDGWLNGLPWNVAGGSVMLYVVDPNGNLITYTMAIDAEGYAARYNYTVVAPASISVDGDLLLPPWRLAFLVIDANGVTQKSRPVAFNVLSSPV